MATLVLQAAGAAVGSFIGGPFGAVVGRAAGGLAGAAIDQALLAPSGSTREVVGPRLADLTIQSSTEGAPIPRVYGRVRIAGQIIWATEFEEVVTTRTETSGGGGKGGGGGGTTTRTTEYAYFANFAVGLCEGPISRIARVWADGKPLDLGGLTMRFYPGDEEQSPDSLIEAKEGAGQAPAYRGLAYVVFERLALAPFGNRIPQISFELVRSLGGLEDRIRAINVIPGATEFGYDTEEVLARLGPGVNRTENRHFGGEGTDWSESIDELQALCPDLETVSLVVAWFGDDLRCGSCEIRPRVEVSPKTTAGGSWSVAGIGREAAEPVSRVDGRPAFGGTPSDRSVINAIRDLKRRRFKVMFHPFLMMDIAAGNSLPDPWSGALGQPAYPWRGRITCDPAPGREGTPDGSPEAGDQVAGFFGSASHDDFSVSGETVVYHGPSEWGWRRMVLHYAHLCAAAGGVDSFLIGSELRALAQIRSGAGSYPAVDALRDLAGEVRQVLGASSEISYAADWSDYFGHQPQDGSGDVHFHFDPLWADPNVDFVGINSYTPLADWRDGDAHLDAALAAGPYDPAYLRSNVAGGEGFDWYYASEADRQEQIRSEITDGAHGKPWVFRYKDLVSWWSNHHYDRPGGVEAAEPTDWLPKGKPIRFTEIGCPAIDKGANQPNVFHDPKSSESQKPYFSSGERDDLIQRRYLEAVHDWWDPESDAYSEGANPVSQTYGGRMVDPAGLTVWTWDARPYPLFPFATGIWADGPNWELGHWLNGRLGVASLDRLVARIAADYGAGFVDASGLEGIVGGYVIDRPMSARDALEPLMRGFTFDAVESGGVLRMRHRGGAPVAAIAADDLVIDPEGGGEPLERRRLQDSEVPGRASLRYLNASADHRPAAVGARRDTASGGGEVVVDLPAVIDQGVAQRAAEIMLQDSWTGRETVQFALARSRLALEAGDVVRIDYGEGAGSYLLTEIASGDALRMSARAVDRRDYRAGRGPARLTVLPGAEVAGPPAVAVIETPLLPGTGRGPELLFAGFADPWSGAVDVFVERPSGSHDAVGAITAPAVLGRLASPLTPGPLWRWDRASVLEVELPSAEAVLISASEADLLDGTNAAAVQAANGAWEIVQFADVELVAPGRYRLRTLLRGQAGSEKAAAAGADMDAAFVLLDRTLLAVPLAAGAVGLERSYRFVPAGTALTGLAAVAETVTPAGIAYRPLSPVHLRAERRGGDIELSWMRRTRVEGDGWAAPDVPLGEESEAYDLELWETDTVLRSERVARPGWTYSEAAQAADWDGGMAGPFTMRVWQISAAVGRGQMAEEVIDV